MRRAFAGLALVAVVLAATAAGPAAVHADTWPPQRYRFTGWATGGVGLAPHHAFVEGDAVVLRFQDAANERPTRYRVCWSHPQGSNRRCWTRVARRFRISSVPTAGPVLHFGPYVARWYVGGRVVATWPFLFDKELVRVRP